MSTGKDYSGTRASISQLIKCQDSLKLCQKTKFKKENDDTLSSPSSRTDIDADSTYLMQMQPKFNLGPPTSENPWGNSIPKNYFCHYDFYLDWDKVYKVTVQRFHLGTEDLSMKL